MATPAAKQFCPYKGLQPYTEADRKYFFGRARDQGIITSNLYAASITIFYGASGVGKSSVLLAGVVPQLREEPRNAAVVVFNKWQADDFVDELKAAVASQTGETGIDPKLSLNEFLEQTQRALDLPMFLIWDQFEEYFLYHPPSPAADAFESEFARTVNDRANQVNFMLSLREDGLSKLDRFQGRIPTMLNNMLRLNHLDADAAREAITKPIEQYNLENSDQPPISIEPGLVDAVVEDLTKDIVASDQSGQGGVTSQASSAVTPIETPFLQMVLTRLWDEEAAMNSKTLRLETFKKLGRAEQIAKSHLDTTMAKLSEAEQSTAANILRYLVTPAGTKIAQEAGALADWSGLPEPEVQNILNRLSSGVRILKTVQVPNQPPRFEIFHDVLADAILGWRARYLQEQRLKETQRQLEAEKAESEARLKRQTTRTKRLRYVIAGLLLIGVVIIFLGAKALQARFLAHARELAAYSKSQLDVDPELSLLLAIEAVKTRPTAKAVESLRLALLKSRVIVVLQGHEHAIRGVAISPEDAYVATACWDGEVGIWQTTTGKRVNQFPRTNVPTMSVSFSPDGKYLVTAGQDGYARVWEDWRAPNSRVIATVSDGKDLWTAAFSPDGQFLVTGGGSGKITIWDWKNSNTPKSQLTVGSVLAPPPSSSPSPSPSPEAAVTVSPAPTGAAPASSPSPTPGAKTVQIFKTMFSPDGERVVIAARDRVGLVWNWKREINSSNPIRLSNHRYAIYDAAFSPDGKYLVTGSDDKTAGVWSLENSQARVVATLDLLPHAVRGVTFTPDGKFVATANDDGVVRIWKWKAANKVDADAGSTDELRGHQNVVYCVAVSADGKFMVTGSEDHTARVWRIEAMDPAQLDKLSTDELLKLASERVTRQLTPEEKAHYLE
jgi:WD40 repeat protein